MRSPRRAVYPGSFDPPTVAHVAVAEAALAQCDCDSLVFMVSVDALGKSDRAATASARHQALLTLLAGHPKLTAQLTELRLIVDIAQGFEVVVMGADKWAQVGDPAWYPDGEMGRDRALAALPHVAVAPRPPSPVPTPSDRHTVLELADPTLAEVSSTAVRSGRTDWLAPAPRSPGERAN